MVGRNSTFDANYAEPILPPVPIINLGTVTTRESVFVNITVVNDTSFIQEYGFLSLPDFCTIQPGYGFGTVYPTEKIDLVLFYSPVLENIKSDELHCCGLVGNNYFYIKCTTVYAEAKLVYDHSSVVKCPLDKKLTNKVNFYGAGDSAEKHIYRNIGSHAIWFASQINDVRCEFDYSYVEFPSTAIGSYSSLAIRLRACGQHTCYCGLLKKVPLPKFVCTYDICCESPHDQIQIEPRNGTLSSGQEIKIILIAAPAIQQSAIIERAKLLQIQKLTSEKELVALKPQRSKSKSPKRKKKSKPSPEKPSKISQSVLYEAEKDIWRHLEACTIQANIRCTLEYDAEDREDILACTAVCPIVKPDFLLNWPTQVIDFGPTVMGIASKIIVELQNITIKDIFPTVSLLSPAGPFNRSIVSNICLEPEHILQIPFTFTPEDSDPKLEFFAIKSGNTIIPMKIIGVGYQPTLTLPKNCVFRLECPVGKSVEFSYQIKNHDLFDVPIRIVVALELNGFLEKAPVSIDVEPKSKKTKSPRSPQKSPRSHKEGGKQSLKLTADEIYSIGNNFEIYDGPSYFTFQKPLDNDTFIAKAKKKTGIKMLFQEPISVSELKLAKSKKKIKKKVKIRDMESEKTAEKSKKVKAHIVKSQILPNPKYLIKYDIFLGHSQFLQSIIVIAGFKKQAPH